jgi:hypothetical protein
VAVSEDTRSEDPAARPVPSGACSGYADC